MLAYVNYQGLFAAGHTFNSVTGANVDISEYSYLIYGAAIVTFMLFRPEGLFPSRRRKRELHAADDLGEMALVGEQELGVSELDR